MNDPNDEIVKMLMETCGLTREQSERAADDMASDYGDVIGMDHAEAERFWSKEIEAIRRAAVAIAADGLVEREENQGDFGLAEVLALAEAVEHGAANADAGVGGERGAPVGVEGPRRLD